ncbi:general secretion pathway protein GspH [Pseudomonas sp. TKO26]|uniref:GspH/FimT family protein n=1 Tax=Pseudomonas TaxID=286 RepID=UPI000D840228|nr:MULTISPECIES: GspH/FimT family protein [Pseudomonas]PYY78325.1 general secretion pathway protein GspH [Pseudomonas sp. TKO30]PYY78997.1 general secretion pathway protein GspH [Pseudomonas sp. TKO29]PYY81000.1 general secretion pathway protein GspH [Pseudomonas sp. TKO26]PYY95999.1 general secretion pathway protein GspH [Pseudomonas sp. TKO14]
MHEKGFSLIELLSALAVLALLLPLSGAAFSELLRSNRQQDTAQMLASGLRNARAAAILHQRTALIHGLDNDWSRGWRIILDISGKGPEDSGNPLLIERRSGGQVLIVGNRPVQHYVRFSPLGNPLLPSGAFQAGTLHICQAGQEHSRHQVVLSRSGRVSLRSDSAEQALCAPAG